MDKWLNDEEDPNYEVIAGKEEGKFTVRKRKPTKPEPEPEPECEDESNPKPPDAKPKCDPEPSPKTVEYQKRLKETRKKPKQNETNVQILEYLKLLGDDLENRKKKKEMKKEVKYQIAKNTVPVEEEYETQEPEVQTYIQYPIRQRRKINIVELTQHRL
jgi:hypothetical protein